MDLNALSEHVFRTNSSNIFPPSGTEIVEIKQSEHEEIYICKIIIRTTGTWVDVLGDFKERVSGNSRSCLDQPFCKSLEIITDAWHAFSSWAENVLCRREYKKQKTIFFTKKEMEVLSKTQFWDSVKMGGFEGEWESLQMPKMWKYREN